MAGHLAQGRAIGARIRHRGIFHRFLGGMAACGQPINSLCRALCSHSDAAAFVGGLVACHSGQARRQSDAGERCGSITSPLSLMLICGGPSGRHATSMAELSTSAQRQNRDQLGRPRPHRSTGWRCNSGIGDRADIFFAGGQCASNVCASRSRLRGADRHRGGGKSSPTAGHLARHEIHAVSAVPRRLVQQVFLDPKAAFPVLSFAVLAQIALGAATFAMAASLGIKVTLLDCMVLMQPVALLANLPISVGGWGRARDGPSCCLG